jgi:hypothetical protein
MVAKHYFSFAQFAALPWDVVKQSLFYVIQPGRDLRVKFYMRDPKGQVFELAFQHDQAMVKSYGPSAEKAKLPARWPGDGYAFAVGFGKLTKRDHPPTLEEAALPSATDADKAAAYILRCATYLIRAVAEDAMTFIGHLAGDVTFAQGTPYEFTIHKRDPPAFAQQINSPTNIVAFSAAFPKTEPVTRSIKVQELVDICNAWIGKFIPDVILAGYAAKPGAKKIDEPYLTLYLPQLDYRGEKNRGVASSAMVLIRAGDYQAALAKSCSANKATEPVKVMVGSVEAYEVRAWEFLDSAPNTTAPPAVCNLFITPELFSGQQKVFRLVVSDIQFDSWKETNTQRERPAFSARPALQRPAGGSGAEEYDPTEPA